MNETDQDELFDRKLRDAIPYIDDEGFTRRVMQRLPVPQPRRSLRGAILLGITVLASALAYVLSDGGRFVHECIVRMARLPTFSLLLVTCAAGILVSAIGLIAALSKSRELQS